MLPDFFDMEIIQIHTFLLILVNGVIYVWIEILDHLKSKHKLVSFIGQVSYEEFGHFDDICTLKWFRSICEAQAQTWNF